MNWDDFVPWARRIADWARDYHLNLRDRPVRAQTAPGAILNALPVAPPEDPQDMADVFADFERIVMPGITHWQHPRFFAYFPSNAAPPSVLAEFLTAAIAPQCMLWQTSPAATEMETRMMDWLRQAVALPEGFEGVIQDSASSATLAAVLTTRERALAWAGNSQGLAGQGLLRVYASAEVHSSVDRAIWISGIGQANLVRIPIAGDRRGMDPGALDSAILADKAAGLVPAGVILCVGGTGTGATDPIAACMDVAERHGLYSHVDAAWSGLGGAARSEIVSPIGWACRSTTSDANRCRVAAASVTMPGFVPAPNTAARSPPSGSASMSSTRPVSVGTDDASAAASVVAPGEPLAPVTHTSPLMARSPRDSRARPRLPRRRTTVVTLTIVNTANRSTTVVSASSRTPPVAARPAVTRATATIAALGVCRVPTRAKTDGTEPCSARP